MPWIKPQKRNKILSDVNKLSSVMNPMLEIVEKLERDHKTIKEEIETLLI